MRLVDTNIFMHFLILTDGANGRVEHDACTALFERVDRGVEEVATTEACLAEIYHVITAKQQYRRPVEEAVAALRGITSQRGILVRQRNLYVQTLEVLVQHPRIGFQDALLAAHALETGWPIVSYDRHFDRVAGITRDEPTQATSM